jgi:uncharacterized membrane protein YfcA
MAFDALFLFASILAGGIAAISGFGIGSVLTPIVATQIDAKLAVAVVSIPHFIGTLFRFIRLRRYVNRPLAFTFGVASALGGLAGAVLNAFSNAHALGYVLASLLVFAGLTGITGLADRIQLKGAWKWIGGFASGGLGGLVGNQGGIRSAAMLGFNLTKESFVATATASALLVDGARMPVYFAIHLDWLTAEYHLLLISIGGVLVGTVFGSRLLTRVPERLFKRLVSALILALGFFMFHSTMQTH